MAHVGFQSHPDLREKMNKAVNVEEIKEAMKELKERRKDMTNKEKLGWYFRHRKNEAVQNQI